jgi:hypothetical protein
MAFNRVADAARIIGFVGQYDSARFEPVEQGQRGRRIVRLTRCHAEPHGQALPIDDRVDLGRATASRATQAMISAPFLRSQPAGAPG